MPKRRWSLPILHIVVVFCGFRIVLVWVALKDPDCKIGATKQRTEMETIGTGDRFPVSITPRVHVQSNMYFGRKVVHI